MGQFKSTRQPNSESNPEPNSPRLLISTYVSFPDPAVADQHPKGREDSICCGLCPLNLQSPSSTTKSRSQEPLSTFPKFELTETTSARHHDLLTSSIVRFIEALDMSKVRQRQLEAPDTISESEIRIHKILLASTAVNMAAIWNERNPWLVDLRDVPPEWSDPFIEDFYELSYEVRKAFNSDTPW